MLATNRKNRTQRTKKTETLQSADGKPRSVAPPKNKTPSQNETLTLVEKQLIRPSYPSFKMLKEFCHLAKNLYNHANYIVRQTFVSEGLWSRYDRLEFKTRTNADYPDYRAMPTAQMAQQVLRAVDANWSSFFQAMKAWKKDKSKFAGRPKMPNYLPKEGFFVATVTNQNAKIKDDGLIHFPKTFGDFTIKPNFLNRDDTKDGKLQQVRILFDGANVVVEVVYRIAAPAVKSDNGRYMGIDLGVANLATCVTNTGSTPMIFKGGVAKSINQYYNKKLAKKKSTAGKRNKKKTTKGIQKLSKKRTRKMNDHMHKVSRKIVDECVAQNINTIIIGKNKLWKVSPKMSKTSNQKFVPIPLARLIELIAYKAKKAGITVLTHEESYTSGTSFLDGEAPSKKFYDKSRRKKRGLFVSNTGTKINADVNAAYQILKKVVPEVTPDGIKGAVLRPVVVTA